MSKSRMLALLVPAALAWSPATHAAMAARAAALEGVAPAHAARFAAAARDEDLNLARKWARWHHYWYDGPLGVRRPSAERVAFLLDRLATAAAAGEPDETWRLAGLLAHHVQDMASPPHVVPVHHGLGDGFEGYPVAALVAAADPPVPELPAAELQPALVARTRAALDQPLVCDDFFVTPSLDLWVAAPPGFGARGAIRFGDLPACDAGFSAFATARVDDAVGYTRALVRWVVARDADAIVEGQPGVSAGASTTTRTPIDPPR